MTHKLTSAALCWVKTKNEFDESEPEAAYEQPASGSQRACYAAVNESQIYPTSQSFVALSVGYFHLALCLELLSTDT